MARYDPYDLQVVPAYSAVQCDVYWTVSASHVSKVSAENMYIGILYQKHCFLNGLPDSPILSDIGEGYTPITSKAACINL